MSGPGAKRVPKDSRPACSPTVQCVRWTRRRVVAQRQTVAATSAGASRMPSDFALAIRSKPAAIHVLDSLPKNAVGKIDKLKLRALREQQHA